MITAKTVKDHLPEILTGVNVVSTIGAVIFTAAETPKALQILYEEESRKGSKLTAKEKIKATWKTYLPAGICTATSILSSVGAAIIGRNQKIELLSAVYAGEKLINAYREEVTHKIGEENEQNVYKEAQHKMYDENPPKLIPGDLGVYETGQGMDLFYEYWSGMLFRSSEEAVRNGYAKFLEQVNFSIDTFYTLNELHDHLYIPQIGGGNIVGWNASYKPGLTMEWDSERHIYRTVYFENPPLCELSLPKFAK